MLNRLLIKQIWFFSEMSRYDNDQDVNKVTGQEIPQYPQQIPQVRPKTAHFHAFSTKKK